MSATGTLAARNVWFLVERAREAGATKIEVTSGDVHAVVTFADEVEELAEVVELGPGAPYTYPGPAA